MRSESYNDMIKTTIFKSKSIVTLLLGDTVVNNETLDAGARDKVSDCWETFPLPCDWQSALQKSISILAYNLCVGCCVSTFSGWTADEFNLDELHTRDDSNVFGLNMEGAYVAGFLSKDAEDSLSTQWEYIRQILPRLEPLRYEAQLNQRKDKEWYQKVMGIVKRQSSKIGSFREVDGLMTLLSFSTLCLVAAKHFFEEKDNLLKLAMSIILPMVSLLTSCVFYYLLHLARLIGISPYTDSIQY